MGQDDRVGAPSPARPALSTQPSGLATAAASSRPSDLLSPLFSDEAAARKLLQQAGPAARPLETEHFVLAYTADEPAARDLAARLEAVYRAHVRFISDFQLPSRRPVRKLEVLLLARYADFQAYLKALGQGAPDVLGCYEPAANRSVFFDLNTYPPLLDVRASVAQAEPQEREKLQRRSERRYAVLVLSVVQHEAAHQIQRNLGLIPGPEKVPTWLSEGLATLFEVPFDSTGEPREAVNAYRLFEFKKLCDGGPRTLPDMARLLTDDGAWCGGKCYPVAWAVMRYLRDEHHSGFVALLRKVMVDGGLPDEAGKRRAIFDELIGPIDERWVGELYAKTMGLSVESSPFGE